MRDLRRRTLTAIAYGAVVLVAVFAPSIVFGVVLVVVAILALTELYDLRRAGAPAALEALLVLLGIGALSVLKLSGEPPHWLLVTILATWAGDIAAYLVGSAVGRHKIAPRISPGKTWEGTIAGVVAAAATVLASQAAIHEKTSYPVDPTIVVAAGVGVAGLAGDLLESWVKRRAGAKDSGTLLPGHGGMLDRIDSLIATALFVAIVLIGLGGTVGVE